MAGTQGPGLGPAYRKLWTAAAVSTVGDGVHHAALALLAASLTRGRAPERTTAPVSRRPAGRW